MALTIVGRNSSEFLANTISGSEVLSFPGEKEEGLYSISLAAADAMHNGSFFYLMTESSLQLFYDKIARYHAMGGISAHLQKIVASCKVDPSETSIHEAIPELIALVDELIGDRFSKFAKTQPYKDALSSLLNMTKLLIQHGDADLFEETVLRCPTFASDKLAEPPGVVRVSLLNAAVRENQQEILAFLIDYFQRTYSDDLMAVLILLIKEGHVFRNANDEII